jgi:hypothetical protein
METATWPRYNFSNNPGGLMVSMPNYHALHDSTSYSPVSIITVGLYNCSAVHVALLSELLPHFSSAFPVCFSPACWRVVIDFIRACLAAAIAYINRQFSSLQITTVVHKSGVRR